MKDDDTDIKALSLIDNMLKGQELEAVSLAEFASFYTEVSERTERRSRKMTIDGLLPEEFHSDAQLSEKQIEEDKGDEGSRTGNKNHANTDDFDIGDHPDEEFIVKQTDKVESDDDIETDEDFTEKHVVKDKVEVDGHQWDESEQHNDIHHTSSRTSKDGNALDCSFEMDNTGALNNSDDDLMDSFEAGLDDDTQCDGEANADQFSVDDDAIVKDVPCNNGVYRRRKVPRIIQTCRFR